MAKLASQAIPAEAVEQFRDLLTIKGSPNGGVAVTEDLKYNSKLLHRGHSLIGRTDAIAHKPVKLNLLARIASMFPQLRSGMDWLLVRFRAAGEKKSGITFSKTELRRSYINRYMQIPKCGS